jgi:hypothetical protein
MGHASSQHLISMRFWVKFTSLLAFLPFVGFGQEIQSNFLQNRYPTFEAADVAKAGIKTIRISEMRKPSSRPIYDDNVRFTYYFDRSGTMIGYRKTYPSLGGIVDTTSMSRILIKGEPVQESEKIGRYQRRVVYERIDSVTVKQTISIKRGASEWEPLSKEKIQTKKITNGKVEMIGGLNDQPYQRIVYQYDNDKNLTSIETWNGSRIQSIEKWDYKNGRMTNYEFKDLLNSKKSSYRFPLDWENDKGMYCQNSDCKDWSIVSQKDGWPKGWIFMDHKTQDMNIWEFDYKYW